MTGDADELPAAGRDRTAIDDRTCGIRFVVRHPLVVAAALWIGGLVLIAGWGWIGRSRTTWPRASAAQSITATDGTLRTVVLRQTSGIIDVMADFPFTAAERRAIGAEHSAGLFLHEHEREQVGRPLPWIWIARSSQELCERDATSGLARAVPLPADARAAASIDWSTGVAEIVVPTATGELRSWWIQLRHTAVLVFAMAIAALTPVVTVVGANRARTARRARGGRCVACGQSRTGLASDRPCPECGRRIVA